jgi:hypothetical protein
MVLQVWTMVKQLQEVTMVSATAACCMHGSLLHSWQLVALTMMLQEVTIVSDVIDDKLFSMEITRSDNEYR